ncbi:MAG: sugar ABC transporter permease [Clostridia bacterium]|nr:sugar ABC transporter permease [Clostridia bacterium]
MAIQKSASATQTDQRKKESFKNNIAQYWFIYAIFALVLAYYIIFKYIPMYGVIIAFKRYTPSKGIWGSEWVGLRNFERFFSSTYFMRTFRNTLILNVLDLIFGFPAPIIFALLLNELRNQAFKRTVQTISYLPHFISIVVVAGMMHDFLNNSGMITTLLHNLFGLPKKVWLNDPDAYRTIYVASDIWKSLGWNAIIYLAALSNIDTELYDSAEIDGCGTLRKMRHVTLPGIASTIIILFILRIGSMLSLGVEKTLLLYNPNTYEVSDIISSFVYRRGFGIDGRADYSFSTAVDLFNAVINLTLLSTANFLARRYSETSLW